MIVDVQNNEPLPFANVLVKGTSIGVLTNEEGLFTLPDLPKGYVRLEISYVGYKSQLTDEIFVEKAHSKYLEIKLERDENLLGDIEVKPSIFNKKIESPISMLSITTKQIECMPGSNRDISRIIQSMPGVGSVPGFRNDLMVRGGGPTENRFYLDGIEIPIINHFSTQGSTGGPVGIINADFIRKVDMYASAFPADKNNALSSILDFTLKDGNKDKLNTQITIGLNEAALTFDGPIGQKTTYIFSVRRSYLQYMFDWLNQPYLPTFTDFQLRLKTSFNTKNHLTIVGLGSLDHMNLNLDIKDPTEAQQNTLSNFPENNQMSYTIGAIYKNYFEAGSHSFIVSRNYLYNDAEKYFENNHAKDKTLDYNSEEIENKLRYLLDYNYLGYKLKLGANLETGYSNNHTRRSITVNKIPYKYKNDSKVDLIKYGFSTQLSKSYFEDRFSGSLGMRVDANNYNSKTNDLWSHFSPRLSLSYRINPGVNISASAGRYYQQAPYTVMVYTNDAGENRNKNTTDYIGSDQYNIGVSYQLNEHIFFSAEGFYKNYFQYPIDIETGTSLANQGADFSVYGLSPVQFTGKGKSRGFELMNRMNFNTFTFLASYTYVHSGFTSLDDKYSDSSWDSRHMLTLTASKDFAHDFKFGVKWRYIGGLPYTPYDLRASASIKEWSLNRGAVYDYDRLNMERLPAFHQLDIRLDKNFYFDKWTMILYIDIVNAYNFKNTTQDIALREKDDQGNYKLINNDSDYVLYTVPNKEGSIQPSMGCIIKF